MEQSQLSITLFGMHFGNFVFNNYRKILIFGTDYDSFKRKKTSVTKSLYHNYCIQVKYTISKYTKKEIEKGICNFLWNNKKVRVPWHVAQLHIWKGGISTLDTDTQLNSTKIKQLQSLFKSHSCSLERSHAILIKFSTQHQPKFSLVKANTIHWDYQN